MAHEFPELPENIYKYENQFDYSVWTPNTEVTCATVPWDASYRDIVRFESEELRRRYFDEVRQYGYSFTIGGMTYLRYGEPVRVNAPFSMVNQCNYLIVRNPVQPVPSTASGYGVPERKPDTFYYFITDIKYIAPNTTQLNVQLDVWQTYYDRISFGLCYVNKGHIGIANENATLDNLSEYLLEPEGLDIGGEYEVCAQAFESFQKEKGDIVAVIMSSAKLDGDLGTVSKPSLVTSEGAVSNGIPTGCSLYVSESPTNLFHKLADKPWISQCINSITYVPERFVSYDREHYIEIGDGLDREILYPLSSKVLDTQKFEFHNARTAFWLPERYRNLKKFLTYPYTCYELTYSSGGEIILKPECIGVADDTLTLRAESVVLPPDTRICVYPDSYNAGAGDTGLDVTYYPPFHPPGAITRRLPGGEGLDMCLTISNFPQVAIVNNMYLYYMASTNNSRAYQFATADWSQQKAMAGARLAFDQSTAGMNNALANQEIANAANWKLNEISQDKNLWNGLQTGISSGVGAIGSFASGDIGGGVAGLANTGLAVANTALNHDWINMTTSAQVGAATATTQNNVGLQGYNRDTNYDYAAFAAKGDYENAIAGIQAKVQDAKLTQPTTAGQNGGDMFNIANGFCGIYLKWKRIKPGAMRQIGDFWLRYGYYVNRWVRPPQDLRCMENFTYWKMQQVQINATMPETFKQAIRGILEKGVTVWSSPSMINNIELDDNEPLEGIRY